ncbi:MAG: branched-chain amino acid ABC transporter permease [Halanaerobiales bacterium]|nr:branched-chain amino acid ABC transporter permease [Halanaerobiales bacterium]
MYAIVVMINVGIFVLLALSLNIITGYAGQPNIGQGAFFGIGAYSGAILTGKLGIYFWLAMPISAIITGFIGFFLGLISIRIKEDFLAIVTIALNFIVAAIFQNVKFFGGSMGLSVPSPYWFGNPLSYHGYLILIIILIILVIIFSKLIEKSWLGMALGAIRNNERAADSLGIDTKKFKIMAFVLGTSIAGLTGAVYAHYMTFIMASDFGFLTSVSILSMVILGGNNTIRGPIVGAIILGLIPEVFRFISDYRLLVYALILILMIRFQPSGLLGDDSFVWQKLTNLRASYFKRRGA